MALVSPPPAQQICVVQLSAFEVLKTPFDHGFFPRPVHSDGSSVLIVLT